MADFVDSTMEGVSSARADRKSMRLVVLGASLGTIFEWYDFFLYIALAVFFSGLFFPKESATASLLASLATFGVGFVVRPFGAILFGHIGDRIGRKQTFIFTIILMGCSTAGIGFLPGFQQIGWAAPIVLVLLRLLQGLSLGGEFGGASTYVAEHSDDHVRGLHTSWVQTTVFFGEILALMAVLVCRLTMSGQTFAQWGWRVPFYFSLVLLAASVYIRMQLEESPLFQELKHKGRVSRAPVLEAFGRANIRPFLVALLLCIGQVVIGYASSVYPFIFMLAVLKVDHITANLLFTIALLISVPLMVFSGWLSDRIGRKWIMLVGCLLAAGAYFPVLHALTHYANPALEAFQSKTPVTIAASDCHTHLFVTPGTKLSSCDDARDFLTHHGVTYTALPAERQGTVVTRIGAEVLQGFDPKRYAAALAAAGYPSKADPAQVNGPMVVLLLVVLNLFSVLTFGPLGAFLVEQFPTRMRYTSVSAAYNFGAGWVGGLTPFFITALSIHAGNVYSGFWFPVAVGVFVFLLGSVLVRETNGIPIREP